MVNCFEKLLHDSSFKFREYGIIPRPKCQIFFRRGQAPGKRARPARRPCPGQKKPAGTLAGSGRRLSKKVKNLLPAADMRRRWQHIQGNFTANCVGGHRPIARFAVKFCRRGSQKGKQERQAPPCATVAPFGACRVSRQARRLPAGSLFLCPAAVKYQESPPRRQSAGGAGAFQGRLARSWSPSALNSTNRSGRFVK